jgi:hypothetical protein
MRLIDSRNSNMLMKESSTSGEQPSKQSLFCPGFQDILTTTSDIIRARSGME